MRTSDWLKALNSKPCIRSEAIAKLESAARNRLLIPGSDETWLVSTVAAHHGEVAFYRATRQLALMHRSSDDQQMTADLTSTTDGSGLVVCSDYSDFNSLHAYATTMGTLCELLSRHYWADRSTVWDEITPETPAARTIARAWAWFGAALADAKVKDARGHWHEFDHGLWTGWRLTTFFNSTLNLAYHAVLILSLIHISEPTRPY